MVNDEANFSEAEFGTVREKTVTWHDPLTVAALAPTLSGRRFLEAIRDGILPAPPIGRLMGFAIDEIGDGRVVFRCVPDESLYNPIGVVHGGLVCTLADTVIGCSVHSLLEPGVAYTSIDLNVNYLRPVRADGGALTATGVVTKSGRRVAFASAEIVDADNRVVATGSGSVLIMDPRSTS